MWSMLKGRMTRSRGGKNETCPILKGGTQAHSKNFKVAQALSDKDAGQLSVDTWVGNRDADYAVDRINHEEWISALSNFATFKNKKKLKIDDCIRSLGVRKESEFWGLGQNRVGKIKAITAAEKSITVESPEQVLTLEANGFLQFYGGAVLRKAANAGQTVGGEANCYEIDYPERTSVLNSPPKIFFKDSLPTDLAVGDYFYKAGDYGERSLASFQEWLPVAAPTSTPFFSINRTIEKERLSGFRQTLTANQSVHQQIRRMTTEVLAFSNAPFTGYFMNPFTENYLVNTIENRNQITGNTTVQYMVDTSKPNAGTVANLGLGRLQFNTSAGQFPVYMNRFIPHGVIYGLNWDTVMVKYLAPKGEKMLDFVRDGGGNTLRLVDDKMSYETRFRIYCQMFLQLPGSCFVIDCTAGMKNAGY